jgi:hypothetical protein
MSPSPPSKRGRPLKFGRPSQLVSITVPVDVINWLATIDDDLGWALMKVYERSTRTKVQSNEVAGLVQLPGNRALILVRPDLFTNLNGVSLIPLADGRAFLALDATKGVADLEVAVLDRLDGRPLPAAQRAALLRMRQLLKQWRQEGIVFESRSIVVAQRPKSTGRGRALSPLQSSKARNAE